MLKSITRGSIDGWNKERFGNGIDKGGHNSFKTTKNQKSNFKMD